MRLVVVRDGDDRGGGNRERRDGQALEMGRMGEG